MAQVQERVLNLPPIVPSSGPAASDCSPSTTAPSANGQTSDARAGRPAGLADLTAALQHLDDAAIERLLQAVRALGTG
jgi:hypothetical protein